MIAMNDQGKDIMATTPTRPTLQKHHGGYSWTSYWRDDRGQLRTKRLGKESDASERRAMARYNDWLQSEWTIKPHVQNPDSDPAKFSAAMLAKLYKEYAAVTFIKRGIQTSHVCNINLAMNEMETAWRHRPIVEIEAHELAALRDKIIYGAGGEPRAVKTVNYRLGVIKAAMVWAATEKGYIPDAKAHAFRMVRPIKSGRTAAISPKPVLPAPESDRIAAQAAMPVVLADAVEVQRLTGMRSGELVIMRGIDIDTGGREWLYTPESHKTEHLGKKRVIAIGPRAKKIIKKYLRREIDAYLFSPREAHAERLKLLRATRTTKLWPSHTTRRKGRPSLRVGKRYTVNSYRRAIFYACVKAKVAQWHPHQLRHSWATQVRSLMGIEGAAAGMGNTVQVAEIYADRSIATAKEVARKVG